jgi:hypothetical protein
MATVLESPVPLTEHKYGCKLTLGVRVSTRDRMDPNPYLRGSRDQGKGGPVSAAVRGKELGGDGGDQGLGLAGNLRSELDGKAKPSSRGVSRVLVAKTEFGLNWAVFVMGLHLV